LSVARLDDGGFFRAVTRLLRLSGTANTMVAWSIDPISASQIGPHDQTGHSLVIDLKSLRPGDYQLELTATVPWEEPVTVAKVVRIIE
jgi:hypothetical protein